MPRGGGGLLAIVDGGGGALGRQMVFEAGRTPVVLRHRLVCIAS